MLKKHSGKRSKHGNCSWWYQTLKAISSSHSRLAIQIQMRNTVICSLFRKKLFCENTGAIPGGQPPFRDGFAYSGSTFYPVRALSLLEVHPPHEKGPARGTLKKSKVQFTSKQFVVVKCRSLVLDQSLVSGQMVK